MLARTHGQPASPTTLGKEVANFVGAPAARAAALAERRDPRQVERRRRQLQRARAPPRRTSTGRPSAARFVDIARPRVQRVHHADRAARLDRRVLRCARRASTRCSSTCAATSGATSRSAISASAPQCRRSRLLDDAAQGQSDRFRECRRQSRRRQRAAAPLLREAADLALAARPHGLDRAAQPRRRARARAHRLARARARARQDRRRPGAHRARTSTLPGKCSAEAVQTVLRAHGRAEWLRAAEGVLRAAAPSTPRRCTPSSTPCRLPAAEKARLKALRPRDYTGLAAQLAHESETATSGEKVRTSPRFGAAAVSGAPQNVIGSTSRPRAALLRSPGLPSPQAIKPGVDRDSHRGIGCNQGSRAACQGTLRVRVEQHGQLRRAPHLRLPAHPLDACRSARRRQHGRRRRAAADLDLHARSRARPLRPDAPSSTSSSTSCSRAASPRCACCSQHPRASCATATASSPWAAGSRAASTSATSPANRPSRPPPI